MAAPYTPQPVLPVGAIMLIPDISTDSLIDALREYYGEDIIVSRGFDVKEFTDYYAGEMGAEIRKYFYYAHSLQPLEGAEQWKTWTQSVEESYTEERTGQRRVNLDPGYLTQAKLVLFSMKGYAHRIYIRDGVYAEVTLQYRQGKFHPLPWTYRDYQAPEALSFWEDARETLRHLLTEE